MVQIKCRKGHINEFEEETISHLTSSIRHKFPICKGTFLEPIRCGESLIQALFNYSFPPSPQT